MVGLSPHGGRWKFGVRISIVFVFIASVLAASCASDEESPSDIAEIVTAPAPKDDAAIFAENLQKAKAGIPTAQHNTGVAYLRGEGVGKNLSAAITWIQLAAGQGNLESQFSLGVLYEQGRGVDQDLANAAAWYQSAAESGHADAQFNLGGLYLNGAGVARDEARAVYWYRQAAMQGLADAQYLLGGLYGAGMGVERNGEIASEWLSQAAQRGHQGAIQTLKALESEN